MEASAGPQPATDAHKPKDGHSGAEETAKDKRSGLGWLRPGPSEGDSTAAAVEEGVEAKRVVLDEAMERQVDEELDLVEAEQKNSAWKASRQAAAGVGEEGCYIHTSSCIFLPFLCSFASQALFTVRFRAPSPDTMTPRPPYHGRKYLGGDKLMWTYHFEKRLLDAIQPAPLLGVVRIAFPKAWCWMPNPL